MEENMEAMVNQVLETATEQVANEPEVVTNALTEAVTQQVVAQPTKFNPWINVGVGTGLVGLTLTGKWAWDKWIGPKLAEKRLERKFMKEARKAAKQAIKDAKATKAQATQQPQPQEPEAPQQNADIPVETQK